MTAVTIQSWGKRIEKEPLEAARPRARAVGGFGSSAGAGTCRLQVKGNSEQLLTAS